MSTDGCGEDLAQLSELLRVVADEKRLRILSLLASRQAMCVCNIVAHLGMSQSLVSHHLRVLRQAGLVRDRRQAQWVYYSVDRCRLESLNASYLALFSPADQAEEAAGSAGRNKS